MAVPPTKKTTMLEHIEIENMFDAERLTIRPGRGVTLVTGEDEGLRRLILDGP